jgi:tetrahydromethanopterin S-methyltransferase subunit H
LKHKENQMISFMFLNNARLIIQRMAELQMKSIKQIADELGLDKQRVYRYINKHYPDEAHQTFARSGVMYFDEAVETEIIQHFQGMGASKKSHHDVHQKQKTASNDAVTTSFDAVVDVLKSELEVKNEQIRELNARLAESNAALVTAQQSAQAAQALHAGTLQNQLTDNIDNANEPTGFVKRLKFLFSGK